MIMAMAFLIVKISGPSIVQVDNKGRRIGFCCVTYLQIHCLVNGPLHFGGGGGAYSNLITNAHHKMLKETK